MQNFNGQVDTAYLEKAADIFAAVKRDSYSRMQISEGDTVLDVGCGPGLDVMALAELVGSSGKVIGFDHDKAMLNQALENIAHTFQDRDISLIEGSADRLPFQDNNFASTRSERLFMHLTSPELALSEIVRVTRPGGRIVIADTDWASLSIDNELPKIEQALLNYRIDQVLNNGYSGRSLYRQFKRMSLSNFKIDAYPITLTDMRLFYFLSMQQAVEEQALASKVVTERELKYWQNELKRAADNDSFYCSINVVMLSANKTE
ncbi:MAG: methyltransferase domain-containing protein [Gammaproteobacteria bacterium]